MNEFQIAKVREVMNHAEEQIMKHKRRFTLFPN